MSNQSDILKEITNPNYPYPHKHTYTIRVIENLGEAASTACEVCGKTEDGVRRAEAWWEFFESLITPLHEVKK